MSFWMYPSCFFLYFSHGLSLLYFQSLTLFSYFFYITEFLLAYNLISTSISFYFNIVLISVWYNFVHLLALLLSSASIIPLPVIILPRYSYRLNFSNISLYILYPCCFAFPVFHLLPLLCFYLYLPPCSSYVFHLYISTSFIIFGVELG